MIKQSQIFFLILLSLTLLSAPAYAGPTVKLCTHVDCKNPAMINITDACWENVQAFFNSPFPTDKDEQDNLVNAIALIELDTFNSLSNFNDNSDSADALYTSISNKNHLRNVKNIMGVLLDQYQVKRHFMRKSIKQSSWSWTGMSSEHLLLQSLSDSKLYILEISNHQLGSLPLIKSYKTDSFIPLKKSQSNTSTIVEDEDFE